MLRFFLLPHVSFAVSCAVLCCALLLCNVLGMQQDNRSVHLVSQEGESFDIKVSVAKMSNLVKTMIDGETNG